MKNHKKAQLRIILISLLSLILFSSHSCFAQKSHFSVSLSPIMPISLKDKASVGFLSGNIGYSYEITKNLSWGLNLGYNKFGSKSVSTSYEDIECNLAYIPLTTGLKVFFNKEGNRGYWVINGGYYFPAADLIEGGKGISSGFGIQIPMKNSKTKIDLSLIYNTVFGGTTKDYVIHNGQISGSTTTNYWYSWASYLTFNIGIVL